MAITVLLETVVAYLNQGRGVPLMFLFMDSVICCSPGLMEIRATMRDAGEGIIRLSVFLPLSLKADQVTNVLVCSFPDHIASPRCEIDLADQFRLHPVTTFHVGSALNPWSQGVRPATGTL